MYRPSSYGSSAAWMLGGFALGALAMFLLDPDRGNRRRALVRDKVYSAGITAQKAIDARSRDLANRARGVRAEVSSALSH